MYYIINYNYYNSNNNYYYGRLQNLFFLQNSHRHAYEFLRNLRTVWARALKKFLQPFTRLLALYQC